MTVGAAFVLILLFIVAFAGGAFSMWLWMDTTRVLEECRTEEEEH